MAAPNPQPGFTAEMDRVTQALRRFTHETDAYVAAASRGAMHRTDLAALAVLMDRDRAEQVTAPTQLSADLGLSASATTAVLDRLERQGHVERSPHPQDRRSVVVTPTEHAKEVGSAMFLPLAMAVGRVYAAHTAQELTQLADLLDEVCAATRSARDSFGS